MASPLRGLVPDDHILKRVDAILDLSWLHDEVRACYCQDNGRPSIDPEAALLRARRRKEKGWDQPTREKYIRHRWQVEGVHGIAKTQHGLARAVGRGLNNVAIQVYLTATVMNLKKIVATQPMRDGFLSAMKSLIARLCLIWNHPAKNKAARVNQWRIKNPEHALKS